MSHNLNNVILNNIFKTPAGLTEIARGQGKIYIHLYVPKVNSTIDMENSITDPIVKIPVRELLFIKEFAEGEIVICKDPNEIGTNPNAMYIATCKDISFTCGLNGSIALSNVISERLTIKNANVVTFKDMMSSLTLITSRKDTLLQWCYMTKASWSVEGNIYIHRNDNIYRVVFILDARWPKKHAGAESDLTTFIRYDMIIVSEGTNTPTIDVHVLRAFANSSGTCTDNINAIDIRKFVKYIIGKNVRNVYQSVKKSDIADKKENGE